MTKLKIFPMMWLLSIYLWREEAKIWVITDRDHTQNLQIGLIIYLILNYFWLPLNLLYLSNRVAHVEKGHRELLVRTSALACSPRSRRRRGCNQARHRMRKIAPETKKEEKGWRDEGLEVKGITCRVVLCTTRPTKVTVFLSRKLFVVFEVV